jgi:hypothetical protein
MLSSKRRAHFLLGSLFLAGLSITPVLLSERVLAHIKCPVRTLWGSTEELCPHLHADDVFKPGAKSDIPTEPYRRPGISGIYRGVNVWGVLRITDLNYRANPLTFSANDNNENPYFKHFTTGTLVSVQAEQLIWNITTRRTNTSNGCTTMMSGTLIQRSNNTARAVYTSTDGSCDLPTNFSSVTELRKK